MTDFKIIAYMYTLALVHINYNYYLKQQTVSVCLWYEINVLDVLREIITFTYILYYG